MITTSGRVCFITTTASRRSGASTATTTARVLDGRAQRDARRGIRLENRHAPARRIILEHPTNRSHEHLLSAALTATRVPPRRPLRRGKNSSTLRKFLPTLHRSSRAFRSRAEDSSRTRMARHLPTLVSVRLRMKAREREDDIEEDVVPEPSDLISKDDVFPEERDEVDDDEVDEPRGLQLLAAVPGPLIAAATFVPTFLLIFFGLSYVVGAVLDTAATASDPGPSAPAVSGSQWASPSMSEALRDPFAASRVLDPLAPSPRPADPRDVTGSRSVPEPAPTPVPSAPPSTPDVPAATVESTRPTLPPAGPSAAPSLPPAQPRPAIVPAPESRVSRAPEPPRQPQAAVLNTTPGRTAAAPQRPRWIPGRAAATGPLRPPSRTGTQPAVWPAASSSKAIRSRSGRRPPPAGPGWCGSAPSRAPANAAASSFRQDSSGRIRRKNTGGGDSTSPPPVVVAYRCSA